MQTSNAVAVVEYGGGKLVVAYEDSEGNEYQDVWDGTKEALHTALVERGYKRTSAARGSDIGGVYVRVA